MANSEIIRGVYAAFVKGDIAVLLSAFAPDEFVGEGDTVIVLGNNSGRYKATGKSFSAPFTHVWKLQNGKAVSFREVMDTVLAQEALH